jgi:type III pantothenate kinase
MPAITNPAHWSAPDYLGLLAVDIGNTNITLGLWQNDQPVIQWRARTVHDKMPDEYGVLLRNFLKHYGLDESAINAVAISSVVPALTVTFEQLSRRYLEIDPLVVTHRTPIGIRIEIDQPAQAGADRIVNAAGVFALGYARDAAAIIVDFGTATTFDVLSSSGAYIGGAISPGIGIAHDALVINTAKLHKIDLLPPPDPIGTNTIHAMQSGIFWGYVALVEGVVSRIRESLTAKGEREIRVLATGGLATLFDEHTRVIDQIVPDLTLEGLRYIYHLNQPTP